MSADPYQRINKKCRLVQARVGRICRQLHRCTPSGLPQMFTGYLAPGALGLFAIASWLASAYTTFPCRFRTCSSIKPSQHTSKEAGLQGPCKAHARDGSAALCRRRTPPGDRLGDLPDRGEARAEPLLLMYRRVSALKRLCQAIGCPRFYSPTHSDGMDGT